MLTAVPNPTRSPRRREAGRAGAGGCLSSSEPSKRPAHRCARLALSMSCPLMRTLLPAFRTDPHLCNMQAVVAYPTRNDFVGLRLDSKGRKALQITKPTAISYR
jgi:hypothetical protein